MLRPHACSPEKDLGQPRSPQDHFRPTKSELDASKMASSGQSVSNLGLIMHYRTLVIPLQKRQTSFSGVQSRHSGAVSHVCWSHRPQNYSPSHLSGPRLLPNFFIVPVGNTLIAAPLSTSTFDIGTPSSVARTYNGRICDINPFIS